MKTLKYLKFIILGIVLLLFSISSKANEDLCTAWAAEQALIAVQYINRGESQEQALSDMRSEYKAQKVPAVVTEAMADLVKQLYSLKKNKEFCQANLDNIKCQVDLEFMAVVNSCVQDLKSNPMKEPSI